MYHFRYTDCAAYRRGQVGISDSPCVPQNQVSSHEAGPYICVWETRVDPDVASRCKPLARIKVEKQFRGIVALDFSADGNKLAAVATDNVHTIFVYDWQHQKRQWSGPGMKGKPPQVSCRLLAGYFYFIFYSYTFAYRQLRFDL